MKKKILAILLGLLTVFSAVACDNGSSVENIDSNSSIEQGNANAVAGKYFLKDSVSEYAVVIPENASEMVRFASEELVGFFREATGVKLPVYTDKNRLFKKDSKYFSIGETTLFMQAGLSVPSDFCDSGVIVKTVEESVFMCGGGDDGSLYAVYELLGEMFGYEYYGRGCYSLEKNVINVNFLQINLAYEPSFEERSARTIYDANDLDNLRRFRHGDFLYELVPVKSAFVHNCLMFVEKDLPAHEEYWLSTNGTNLCFTARGNKAEYDALVQSVTDTTLEALKNERERKYMLIALNDCEQACGCVGCKEMYLKYGANSASLLLLCNDVRANIDEWFAGEGKEYARDDFTFGFLAYMDSEDAPVKYNEEKDVYEGVEGIKCNDGVCVMYAPIYHDYTRPLSAKVNEATERNFRGWDALTDTLILWGYDQNFQMYYTIYDTLGYAQEFIKLAEECNVEYHFMQGNTSYSEQDKTSWAHLHEYVFSKLSWNVDLHVPTLIDNFFDNFYGPASDILQQIYTEQTVHCSYMRETYDDFGGRFSCETSNLDKRFWPKQLIEKWITDYEKAHEAIERYKTEDPALYQEYYERVSSEEAGPLLVMLSLYQGDLDAKTVEKYKARFKQITSELGFVGTSGSSIQDLWLSLGISY